MARVLHLTSPLTHGEDVRALQRSITARLAARHDPIVVKADGEYGPATAAAEAHAAWLLGAAAPHDHARAQTIIRHPSLRTPLELARATKVLKAQAKAATTGAAGAVKLGLELANHQPHYTENPAGSNTDRGGIIDQAQREVGIAASYYCGAGVHYMVKHGGGVNLTPDVRYCPSIVAHAKAGTGGLKAWIPAARANEAVAGDIVVYAENGVAAHTELLTGPVKGDRVTTVGWNTSSSDSGSQSNGGGIFPKNRPLGGSFPVIGFARVRWH